MEVIRNLLHLFGDIISTLGFPLNGGLAHRCYIKSPSFHYLKVSDTTSKALFLFTPILSYYYSSFSRMFKD